MTLSLPPPYTEAELSHFLDTFLYRPEAFLIDEVSRMDADEGVIEARMDTGRPLPFAAAQRTSAYHPGHVSGAEIVMITGGLGCLHAYFFHGCRWDEGWAGFGNRIHRADFKRLARIGQPRDLVSRETRTRVGPRRVLLRYAFEFQQEGRVVYLGDQTAMFFRDQPLDEGPAQNETPGSASRR
jgi:hypothetical protein